MSKCNVNVYVNPHLATNSLSVVYSGRLKYSAHILDIGHILGGMFPHTDKGESFGFFFFERPRLGEHHRVENF